MLVVFALALLAGSAVAAERRVALVVGVSAYRAVPPLRNTRNDASGVSAALGRLGFEVDTVLDPDRSALETAVRRLGVQARGADVALFFYAGHAVESGGRNWLLPISADIRGGRDLRFESVELDALLEQLEGTARMAVVVLDACRDNPFRSVLGEAGRGVAPGGLARVQAAVGTLVVFSTAPGTVAADGDGANSPFTAALLKRIEAPGVEFRQVLAEVRRDVRAATHGRQVPWEQSAMEGALILKPVATAAPEPVSAGSARPELEADALFWDSVRASKDPADLKAYLARFPDGVFAALARSRLRGLEAAGADPSRRPTPADDGRQAREEEARKAAEMQAQEAVRKAAEMQAAREAARKATEMQAAQDAARKGAADQRAPQAAAKAEAASSAPGAAGAGRMAHAHPAPARVPAAQAHARTSRSMPGDDSLPPTRSDAAPPRPAPRVEPDRPARAAARRFLEMPDAPVSPTPPSGPLRRDQPIIPARPAAGEGASPRPSDWIVRRFDPSP
jgi:uncharacterized caspase-like protein